MKGKNIVVKYKRVLAELFKNVYIDKDRAAENNT